jgi:hypothetical protein
VTTVGAGSLGHWAGGVSRAAAGRPARADGRGASARSCRGGPGHLDGLAVSLRAVAETLLEQTNHTNTNSAKVALRTRAQARSGARARKRGDLARAASAAPGAEARLKGERLDASLLGLAANRQGEDAADPGHAAAGGHRPTTERSRLRRNRAGPAVKPMRAAFREARAIFLCPRAIRLYDYVAIQEATRCRGPETP